MPQRRELEYMADVVERTLWAHKMRVRVTGGRVEPRMVLFYLQLPMEVRFIQVKHLADDLAMALRVDKMTVTPGKNCVELRFPHKDLVVVSLARMLSQFEAHDPTTMLLGLSDEGVPLMARLSSPDVAHALVSGTTGSGKTVLLKSMAASVVLNHPASKVRLVCIDPKGSAFGAFAGMPHLVRPVVTELNEAVETLRSVVRLMERRKANDPDEPTVLVFIDEVADLVMAGGNVINEQLARLAQRGREARIHLVAATQRPSAGVLSGLMRANFPLRLTGKVVSAEDARIATGRGKTEAHELTGQGDFLAIQGSMMHRFQVAYATETELREMLRPHGGMATAILPEADSGAFSTMGDTWLQNGVIVLMANWSWWEKTRDQWGAKKAVHELLFPGKPYGGVFVEKAEAIIQRADVIKAGCRYPETTTTTGPTQPKLSLVSAD